MVIDLLLYLAALLLFILAAFGVGHPRVNLIAAGLACWVAVPFLHAAHVIR